MESTKEPQYNALLHLARASGLETLGLMTNQVWHDDPKRLVFTLARYKFVSKMFDGYKKVLEVGCGDGFGSKIVKQTVDEIYLSDFDPLFVDYVNNSDTRKWVSEAFIYDGITGLTPSFAPFDGIYSLDVLEHIPKEHEAMFISNIISGLSSTGSLLIGMPSLESQPYASHQSKIGHVNCKTGSDLKSMLSNYFSNVFIFSMNDEVVHTGFEKMSHYLFALCCMPKIYYN
jgi:2-polyprenyl-3-methyl-5-hydroxy-6-metoxy-1,4-benzoquinol methylase